MYNITLIACGTFNDLYNNPVGAIDIFCASNAGTQIKNVQFSNIDITDSKNDAILIKKVAGDGIYNLSFKYTTVNGTAKEYPFNNKNNSTARRGYFVQFANAPNGNGTFCNMNYYNRGGNAISDENKSGIGTFSWSQDLVCTPLSLKEFSTKSVVLFPNPSNTNWNFSSSDDTIRCIQIMDVFGKLMLSMPTNTKEVVIDTSNFNSGIYFAKVTTATTSETIKLLKK